MINPLTELTYNDFDLHQLGEVSIKSQSSRFEPGELGQKEIRQLVITIETFEQDFDSNYNLIQQGRAALAVQNKRMKWVTPATSSFGGPTEGTTILDRPVVIVSHNLPEDPNASGTYNQLLQIVIEYELNHHDDDIHLSVTFQRSDSVGSAIGLGNITKFLTGYRATRYSELRNIRERAAGNVAMTGEVLIGLGEVSGDGEDTRRAQLLDRITELKDEINSRDGRLVYGNGDDVQFFNKVVRVTSFEARINQAVNGIEWDLSADYTEFPNEATYCAADFKVKKAEDRETGEVTLTLSGRIGARKITVANAKLELIKTAALVSGGFTSTLTPIRSDVTPRYLDTDDTQTPDGSESTGSDADVPSPTTEFIELEFDIQWRKRASNLVSWKLSISTEDDTASGLMTIIYSGSVIASGATADAAYATAAAKAAVLGDKKYSFRMSSRVTRSDRQIESTGPLEFLEVTFEYKYKVKGQRIYMESTSETNNEAFGEDSVRVSGFIVAKDLATARATYTNQILNQFNGSLIKQNSTTNTTHTIQNGSPWFTGSGLNSMFVKLDFSLTVFLPKATGNVAFEYQIKTDIDYVALKVNATVEGIVYASQSDLAAIESNANPNVLDTFLASLPLGNRLTRSTGASHQRQGNNDFAMGLRFTQTYVKKLTGTGTILQCELNEEIVYSGTRWQFMPLPDSGSPDVPQDCGVERGSRIISGTVTAVDETNAMNWIKQQRQLAFPTGMGGGAAPAKRYIQQPRITRSFEFLPLDSGTARGTGANVQLVKLSFAFPEALPLYPYAD